MSRIFLSYRRGDEAWASHLDRIQNRKGITTYFRDRIGIKDAQDFGERIQTEILKSDIVLVGIGSTWIDRIRDLFNPKDWVRKELELANGKILYPILFGETQLPDVQNIPYDLKYIFNRNISRLNGDVDRSLNTITNRIREIFQEERDKTEQSVLNGLKGVLNIAWRRLSEPINDDLTVFELARYLVPQLVSSKSQTLGALSLMLTKDNLVSEFGGVSGIFASQQYLLLNVKQRRQIRLAASGNHLNQTHTIILYENFISTTESRFVLIEYSYPNSAFVNYEKILDCLGNAYHINSFRLPTMPIFEVEITRKDFSHSFKPFEGQGDINTDQFTRLFDIQWLGSKTLYPDERVQLIQVIKELSEKHNLIHCMEIPIPTLEE